MLAIDTARYPLPRLIDLVPPEPDHGLVLYAGGTRVVVRTGGMLACAVCLAPTARVLSGSAVKSAPNHLVAQMVRVRGGIVGLPLCAAHLPAGE